MIMKKTIFLIALATFMYGCKESKDSAKNDANSEEWISLFNGKDLNDWDIKIAGHELGDNYLNTFRVEDSMFRVVYDDYEAFDNAFGHIYYKTPFSYYKIKMDYRFVGDQVPGGESWANRNNGIMLHSQSAVSNSLDQSFPVSIEFQLLGGLTDGNDRPTANLCTPGTIIDMNNETIYDHCINSNSETYNGEQWVHVEAIVLGSESITHIVNRDTVMVYQNIKIGVGDPNSDKVAGWKAFGVDNLDEWLTKDGKPLDKGYIALQAESSPTDFKNIELLNLCGCMDKKAKNYKSYFVKVDNSTCIYD
jgi:hypothetical protein